MDALLKPQPMRNHFKSSPAMMGRTFSPSSGCKVEMEREHKRKVVGKLYFGGYF